MIYVKEKKSSSYLTNNSRKTTLEQQPTKTPIMAKVAFVFMTYQVSQSLNSNLTNLNCCDLGVKFQRLTRTQ